MKRAQERAYAHLSPFELKDQLIALAAENQRCSAHILLNAGRGNPNWIATTPREAFFTLGHFAIAESRRSFTALHLGGRAELAGICDRFATWAAAHPTAPGLDLLQVGLDYGVDILGLDRSVLLYELVDSSLGDQYPTPVRILPQTERIVHAYLMQAMGAEAKDGPYDLFAVEGATAAISYLFNSLMVNCLLRPGDTIALGVPIFTPYLELPQLPDYRFQTLELVADEHHRWQYPDAAIAQLADPSIKALFLVNPSNPSSYALHPATLERLIDLVQTRRRDLMIITDDVYGTFVNDFRSLMVALPHNTLGVYSFSKYFGCTGWRLGVMALHPDNVFDQQLAQLPATDRQALAERYSRISLVPEQLKFIDRLVADSRQVSLNHTAGLSLPQQAQMALFSVFALLDHQHDYQQATQAILQRRLQALYQGLGLPLPDDPLYARYYATLDFEDWMRTHYGQDFVTFVQQHYEPLDLVFRLAEQFAIVVLNGSGFEAPDWSVRVSLANLPDDAYTQIGAALRTIMDQYLTAWQAATPDPDK
jgi:aspartate 4-decarboxylase